MSKSALWRGMSDTCWYDTIKERRDTVFPVPEGISSTQCPCPIAQVSDYQQIEAHNYVPLHPMSFSGHTYTHIALT